MIRNLLDDADLKLSESEPFFLGEHHVCRIERAVLQAFTAGFDQLCFFENPEMVRQCPVLHPDFPEDLVVVYPRIRLDIPIDLSADELIEDILFLDPGVHREEQGKEHQGRRQQNPLPK